PQAVYVRSLRLLERVKQADASIRTKSGIMVGLGESPEEVSILLDHLREVRCDFLTIGQYLAPSKNHHPVVEYIHPDIFQSYKEMALQKGFLRVASGPFVRSSYHAEKML
ncbi:MAG: lipoyl synthase, partial [Clostridia bacterium]